MLGKLEAGTSDDRPERVGREQRKLRWLTNWMCRLLGVTADEEYGGLDMGYQAHCIVMEELSRASGMLLSQAAFRPCYLFRPRILN